MTILPRKPSELIRVALADLAKVERSTRYCVDMGLWHHPIYGMKTVCAVCFAGAVIAKSLGTDPETRIDPDTLPKSTRQQMYALNDFRAGCIDSGLKNLGYSERTRNRAHRAFADMLYDDNVFVFHTYVAVEDYSTDPKGFRQSMRKIARKLAQIGL